MCRITQPAPDYGVHAVCCGIGPGWNVRHNAIRDTWAQWLRGRFGAAAVQVEQLVPAWTRRSRDGAVESAVLDIVLTIPGRGRFALDISVTEAASTTHVGEGRAARAGAAARHREAEKHRRYPAAADAPILIPMVYEAGGRAGGQAEAFLRSVAADEPERTRAEVLTDLRLRLATALHRGNAALLLSTEAPAGGWPWARAPAA